jgi:adenylosuccinate lyase
MITAISPLDGRYHSKVKNLENFFSEFALIKFRVHVEIEWLIHMAEVLPNLNKFSASDQKKLREIYQNLTPEIAQRVKDIESTTNHDVKAVEYFIKEQLGENFKEYYEYVHFACTSEDINNLSYALMLKSATNEVLGPKWNQVLESLLELAKSSKSISMLSRTHGQTASPTTLGKEMLNVTYRIKRKLTILGNIEFLGKINGAVGNFNAHVSAYPELNWIEISENFVTKKLGLDYNLLTIQIEPHDSVAELLHLFAELNTILIDFDRDIWGYISLGYFKQKLKEGEVGSSTMPHKVNPIDFENSEGNAGLSNSILNHLAEKLPISRWQRDLTDSTVLRNLGVGFGYALLAIESVLKGISKLEINHEKIAEDLNNSWEVLAEPIQTVMRKYAVEKPYEKLKALTRGQEINQKTLHKFLETLEIPQKEIENLKKLTPSNYNGIAEKIFDEAFKRFFNN